MNKWIIFVLVSLGALVSTEHSIASTRSPDAATLSLIAVDIEGLKEKYPQLKDFSAKGNQDAKSLSISYAYRTHKATHPGGWTSGVPNPDEDGIWFYLDFHDPTSNSQIHTQPITGVSQCLGEMRVSFLLLDGSKTTSVNAAIWQVLRKYGVIECRK